MTKRPLTTRQAETLDFIVGWIGELGRPPTMREMSESFGWSSTNAAAYSVRVLEKKGWIERDRTVARGIRVLP